MVGEAGLLRIEECTIEDNFCDGLNIIGTTNNKGSDLRIISNKILSNKNMGITLDTKNTFNHV